uniref:Putative plant transposon protein domain-containing protein n=1 Tax=Cajanus cajan TaxID=3821 RepID=A0A151QN53_CAJCA|nr:hypothetical protein KK1_047848 [Cajanus cajan]
MRGKMTKIAKVWMTFLFANVTPTTHVSDIRMSRAHLLYTILHSHAYSVDIAAIISDEMYQFVTSSPSKKAISAKPGFSCPDNCIVQTTKAPTTPIPPRHPPMPPVISPMEQCLSTQIREKFCAIRRGLDKLNESCYRFTLHQYQQDSNPFSWPTPEQFTSICSWPEDRPIHQEMVEPEVVNDEVGGNDQQDEENEADSEEGTEDEEGY